MRTTLGFLAAVGLFSVIASCSSGGGTPGGSSSGGKSGAGGSAGGPTCDKDLNNDVDNCGKCGNQCGPGKICSAGVCGCTPGLSECNGACVNLTSDGNNCGTCGTVCSPGFCSNRACVQSCPSGEMQCGNSCVNFQTDPTNCGFCGNQCSGGQACSNGACGCPAGQTTCNGVCVDTKTSALNCGMCGMACSAGQSCVNSQCGGGGGGSGGAGGGAVGMSGGAGGAAGGVGGGAGGSGGGTVMVPGRSCPATPGLLADFEEGSENGPALLPLEDRSGAFEIFNDGKSTTETMTVEASGGTAECDKWALHVKGSGYSEWGAGFGFSLIGEPKSPTPYNAAMHQFTGIKFKAKLGAETKSPVRFNISTPWTENKENPGGMCTPTTATANKAAADCYQHVGKFLSPGAGADELGTSWKTFTFCFDRDLYPLSLPSNLTTEQRNNIATSILKVQFQFNRGKDYSGGYPTNGEFPAFKPELPFDFWIDDVSFFTGECPNQVTSPSNNSPAKPFPQNENIGSCAPATNAPKFAGALAEAYARWTKNFVQGGKIVAPEQNNDVTSEAIAYGMMIAAAMGDKTAFDKFWSYAKDNGVSGSGLMNWKNGQSGSASDADADMAYALLMADKQWPSAGYKASADSIASNILSKDLVNNIIRGGSSFQSAPFNASYFSPAAFRKFASGAVVDANYALVNANVNAPTKGVPTDWADPGSGAPSGPGSAQVTSDIKDGDNGAMGYDAARVPWRLALDACLGGGNTTAVKAIVDYFGAKYDNGASIDLMKAGWYKKMDAVHPSAKDSQGSFIGPMGAAGMAVNNAVMRDRAFRAILDILESGDFNHTYFPSTVGLLTALMMSGNFPTP